MIIGVPKESFPDERRVAVTPAVVPLFTGMGLEVLVESGAGEAAGHSDDEFRQGGARIAPSRKELFLSAEIVLQVLALSANPHSGMADLAEMSRSQILIGFLRPLGSKDDVIKLAQSGVTAFAVELIPRITRAQPMDALSSMSTVAGYKAVLAAADLLPKFFPLLMTAAGTIKPARLLVIGAGVLGLQAIATARRLGAVVQAYDVRPAVRQEVESLGASFVEIPLETGEAEEAGGYAQAKGESFYQRQRALLTNVVAQSDVVISAAVVPGSQAPVLITEEMVQQMRRGSVVLDLAGERGGNCALSEPGQTLVRHGVTIGSPINIASSVPVHASQMYAKNMAALLRHLIQDGKLKLDREDQTTAGALVTHGGEVVNAHVREFFHF